MRKSEETMRKILTELLNSTDFVTLNSLSQSLDISKRSVQNYLGKAEFWLQEHELSEVRIVKKQGYGIRLTLDDAARQKLTTLLSSRYFTLMDGSAARRIELLRSLVFSREELTIQFLADSFFVSRSVILSDLDWAENWLSQYKLKLFKTQGRGIGIVGDEVSRRSAIAGFFDLCEQRDPAAGGPADPTVRLAKERLDQMEGVYGEADIRKVCNIIEEAENKFDFFMGSEYFTSLATHITISVYRMRHGFEIKKEFLPPDNDFPPQEINTARYIAECLESTFSVKLPEAERAYICIHLMSYNAFQEQNAAETSVPENVEMLALHLIEAVDAEVGGNFSSDKILFFGLLYHLRSSIYQQKENAGTRKRSKNLTLPDSCRELHRSIQKQKELYREYAGILPDTEEILSLTLHFALSQERNTAKWRALLVSNAGVIQQMDQRTSLQDSLPQIEIVDSCTPCQFSIYPSQAYDFIISTGTLNDAEKPVANISHMTRAQGVSYIEEFIFTKMNNKDGGK